MTESYKHPMNYYLLVGGSHDGEPWDGDAHPYLVLPARKNLALGNFSTMLEPVACIDNEEYTLRTFYSGKQQVQMYGLRTMSDMEVQLALMRGYNPRGGHRGQS